MKIRKATVEDIPVLVEMYIDLVTIAYPKRRIAPPIIFYDIVVDWILTEKRVRVTYNNTELTGFSYISTNNAGGLTETLLDAEISYVKVEYRKSRAAYLIYKDGFDYALSMNMGMMSTSNIESSPIVGKRFGAENTFLHWEIPSEYINNLNKQYK